MLAREAGLHPSQLSKWRRSPEVRSSSDMVAEPENQNIRPSHRRVLRALARTQHGCDVNALLTRGFKIETMGDLVARLRLWMGKLSPLAFARHLIAFFIGVAATLALQSYRDATREEKNVAAPAGLDSLWQSVDKLAAEIAKVKAAEQDILDRISTALSHPTATPARNPVPRSSQARP